MQTVLLESVSKAYGREFALHRVSTAFQSGELTALVGDNGSGKTTLLKVMATLEAPSRGEITYDDVDWEGFGDYYRDRVGWIAHESLLYDSLTGRENLNFYARMYDLESVDERVERGLERVGLVDDADRRVAHYSRGMRQRLSIARALLQAPELLLFDEPLNGLDRSGRRTMLELLETLCGQNHVIVVASHALSAVGDVADRVAILDGGELQHTSPLDSSDHLADLYREYA